LVDVLFGQPIDHGVEMDGGGADPVGQCAAMQFDPGSGQDLALAV